MSIENFDDLKISSNIKKSVKQMGFKNLTPIQKLAIPQALKGHDIVGQAQTGSGKTIAFAVPILEKIFVPDKSPQAIILCPTRELCVQVSKEFKKLSSNNKKVKILAVYGGESIGKQTRVLKKGVHIIVGTPGRVIDHMNRGNLNLIGVETVVLDEADEMLDMGFRQDIETILNNTPRQRQTLLFSATMPDEIKRITKLYQKKAKFLKIAKNKKNIPKITQYYYESDERDKFEDLCRLIDVYDPKLCLVFCNTKKRVDFVVKRLIKRGYACDGIHGDMKQGIRDKVMNKFRNGNINILVASDVAARGIDIANINLVINYDLAQNNDRHIHRIGRTARAGKTGYAFCLVSPNEHRELANIKKYNKIVKKDIPSFKKINEIKNKLILDSVENLIKTQEIDEYIKVINSSNLDSVELAAGLLKMVREN